VDNEYYFKREGLYGHFDDGERYAYFCKAVVDMLPHIGFFPDILHANDWQAALSVVYLSTEYRRRMGGYEKIRTVFTIHNIEYQGQYAFDILEDVFDISAEHKPLMAYDGCINLMKAAIQCADRVTTVSETYAHEIMTPDYSHRLHYILSLCAGKVSGILNGIDTVYYNPAADPDIPVAYSADAPAGKAQDKLAFQHTYALPEDADAPLLAVVSRLSPHKGMDLIAQGIRPLLEAHPRAQFVLLGTGEGRYEDFFRQLEADFHDRVRCFILYNRALSKKIYAAADIFLMPSQSEPCGLSQMIACRYGAVPVVRETGGLYDSIKPFYEDGDGLHGNGFTFANYSAAELQERTSAALALYDTKDAFATLRHHAMTSDFSWDASAEKYMAMYQGM
jgi:starch synthase